MLRRFLLLIAVAVAGVGALLVSRGIPAWPMAIWGTVLLLAVVFERWRYRQKNEHMPGDWEETEERFVDPESGKLMQVWYQPSTGERRYLPATEHTN